MMKCKEKNLVEDDGCDWTSSLCKCGDQENLFKYFIVVGVIINGLCVLLSAISLKWKINYFRMWTIIFCTARLILCLLILLNLFDDEILFRGSIFIISWWPGIVTIFVYLSTVIRVIPRLNLNQYTNSGFKTIWIPKGEKRINVLLCLISLFTLFGITISSVTSDYYKNQLYEGIEPKRRDKLLTNLRIAKKFVWISIWIPCIITLFLFIYYGGLLVSLTKSCLKLVGLKGKRFKANLRRMQLYNWLFGFIFGLSSVGLFFFVIFSDNNISSNTTLNIIGCITLNIIIPITFFIILLATINVDILESKPAWGPFSSTELSQRYSTSNNKQVPSCHNASNKRQTPNYSFDSFNYQQHSITCASSQLESNRNSRNSNLNSQPYNNDIDSPRTSILYDIEPALEIYNEL